MLSAILLAIGLNLGSNSAAPKTPSGVTISFADETNQRIMPTRLFAAMVEAGEAGGVLDEALKRLAKLLEDNAKLQNQIKGALGYPVAVLVIAILVFLGMTIFLIPTFAGISKIWAPSCRPSPGCSLI